MCGGDEWWSETLWCDTKVMWFDWTGGGELIDSERLGVEAQQVCVGWRGPSRHFIRCCTSLIFSLNLVWLWKGGREEVPVAFCTASVSPFSFWRRGEKREKRERRGGERPLLACQELSHNPRLTSDALCFLPSFLLQTLLRTPSR